MAAEQLAQSYRREASLLLQSLGTLPCDDDGDDARGDFSGISCSSADKSAKSSKLIHQASTRRSSSSSGRSTVDLAEIGRRLVLRGSSVPATSPAQRRVAGADRGSAIAAAAAAPLSPDFYCVRCGQIFAPGGAVTANGAGIGSSPPSIRLRTLSRGRTRRRRCSRVRARGCTRDERLRRDRGSGGGDSGAGGGGQRGHCHAVAASVQIDRERRLIKSQSDVGDGTKYNCIVYKCGYCGARTKFGGLDVAARERRRNMGGDNKKRKQQQGGTSTIGGAAKKIAGKGRADGRGINTTGGLKSSPTFDSGETDFISLAPLPSSIANSDDQDDTKERAPLPKEQHSFRATASESKKAANAATAAASSSSPPSVQRLDQLPSRKRKKKENKKGKGGSNKKDGRGGGEGNRNKKSKLMDFLSTLNG